MIRAVILLLISSFSCMEVSAQTQEKIKKENILKILRMDRDSIANEFNKILPCEQLELINKQFVKENDSQNSYLYDDGIPLSIMLNILACNTGINSADGTHVGLMWMNVIQIRKDYLAWKKYYGCE